MSGFFEPKALGAGLIFRQGLYWRHRTSLSSHRTYLNNQKGNMKVQFEFRSSTKIGLRFLYIFESTRWIEMPPKQPIEARESTPLSSAEPRAYAGQRRSESLCKAQSQFVFSRVRLKHCSAVL